MPAAALGPRLTALHSSVNVFVLGISLSLRPTETNGNPGPPWNGMGRARLTRCSHALLGAVEGVELYGKRGPLFASRTHGCFRHTKSRTSARLQSYALSSHTREWPHALFPLCRQMCFLLRCEGNLFLSSRIEAISPSEQDPEAQCEGGGVYIHYTHIQGHRRAQACTQI